MTTYTGTAGNNFTVDYSAAVGPLTINLAGGSVSNGDFLVNIHNVIGTSAGDTLIGDDSGDLLNAGNGNNFVSGGAGNDTLQGGSGSNFFDGGGGINTVTYAWYSGAVTADLFNGLVTRGDGGQDTLTSIQKYIGSTGNNYVTVGTGTTSATASGGGFNTLDFSNLVAALTIDLSSGTASEGLFFSGFNNAVASAGSTTLLGNDNGDVLQGQAGADNVIGGAGNDTISGGGGNNYLDGGSGTDTLTYAWYAGSVTADLGNGVATRADGGTDTLVNFQNYIGSTGNDYVYVANSTLHATGNGGTNTLDFSEVTGALTASLLTGTASSSGLTSFSFTGFQKLVGNDAGDSLVGGSAVASLTGGAGNDTLVSGTANETLVGGAGIDIAVFSGTHAQYTITNNHDGTYTVAGNGISDVLQSVEKAQFSDTTLQVTAPVKNDFNGDGYADTLLYLNDGNPAHNGYNPLGSNPPDTNVGNGNLWLAEMNGTSVVGGGFVTNVNPGDGWTLGGLGDFNHDGKTDILWRHAHDASAASDYVWLYAMDGNNVQFGSGTGTGLLTTVSPDWKLEASADFNGDGTTDLLWRNTNSSSPYYSYVWIYAMGTDGNGNPTILPTGGGLVTTVDPTVWNVVGTGDFYGDGHADILWERPSDGAVWMYHMNGAQLVGANLVSVVGTSWKVEGTGDFNADGKADIVFKNTDSASADYGKAYIYEMNGSTIINSGYINGINDPNLHVVEVADLNSDGKADIVWQETGGPNAGNVYVSLMNGTQEAGTSPVLAYNLASSWHVIGG